MSERTHHLFYPPKPPARSEEVNMNASFLTHIGQSHFHNIPTADDNWNFKGAVGLDRVA